MATRSVGNLPADGGASFLAGWSSAEVAVAALGVFLVFYVVAVFAPKTPATDLAFFALVTGGLLVTWPVMILLTGAAAVFAVVVGIAFRMIAPKRAAEIDAESNAIADRAIRRMEDAGKRES